VTKCDKGAIDSRVVAIERNPQIAENTEADPGENAHFRNYVERRTKCEYQDKSGS